MKRFVGREDRRQATLLPDTLQDFVAENNPVRVIDVFIDELDLKALGFAGAVPEAIGRSAYRPAPLLKIYLYGYLNRIQSSRRLERETQCNTELMWLASRLMPDFKTIADFRRDNGAAICAAGEWRFVNLPQRSEQGLRELRCFFRHQDHGGGKDGKGGDKATRFVLELELERHGELQLDGLVRARRFDLLLRSRRPLPALVRGDLMALFEEANAIAGYNGQLVFQASADWLQLLAAQSAAQPHDGLNA